MISQNTKSKSQFVGYLGVKNVEKIERDLILPLVEKFFSAREIANFKPIDANAAFADLDFQSKNFEDFFGHFYEFIVDSIHKNADGKIEIPVTYCITLDETNCLQTCEKTGIRYDEMLLFDTPVFYFLYVDIKAIFSYLKNSKNETN